MSHTNRLGVLELNEADAARLCNRVPSDSRDERVQEARREAAQLFALVHRCRGMVIFKSEDIIAGILENTIGMLNRRAAKLHAAGDHLRASIQEDEAIRLRLELVKMIRADASVVR